MADFRYGVFDAQLLMMSTFHVMKSRGNLTKEGLITRLIYSISKVTRDIQDCDKVILAWDGSPYHRAQMLHDYKGDRFYVTEDFVENYEDIEAVDERERSIYLQQLTLSLQSQGVPQEEIDQRLSDYIQSHPTYEEKEQFLEDCRYELYCNEVKQEAKYWMIENLSKIGIPSLYFKGYEADDLAKMVCDIVEKDDKPSYICSKDGDWTYLINPNTSVIRSHTGQVITYEEKIKELPEGLNREWTLYQFKAAIDSFEGSHNNLYDCTKDRYNELNLSQRLNSVEDKEKLEEICDSDLFMVQFKSFDYKSFPDYPEVSEQVKNILRDKESSQLMSDKMFATFARDNSLRISTKYYSDFRGRLSESEYAEARESKPIDLDEIFNNL